MVSYLASSRSDVFVGSFIADTFPLFGCDKKSTDRGVVVHTPSNLPSGRYEIAAFVSGIMTQDKRQKTKIAYSINNQQIIIEVTSTAFPAVQNLHISYVLVSAHSKFISLRTFTPTSSTYRDDYQVIGPVEVTSSRLVELLGVQLVSQKRLTCIGSGCIRDCIPE